MQKELSQKYLLTYLLTTHDVNKEGNCVGNNGKKINRSQTCTELVNTVLRSIYQ